MSYSFDNFKPLPGTTEALAAFKQVIDGPRYMLLAYGGVGNGKTHLCNAAATELCQRGLFTRVMDFQAMLATLKRAISDPQLNYLEVLKNYSLAERLIMDDIGSGESDTEYADRILESIVVTRYGRGLLTIMATNKDISTFPERVLSRLQDKTTSFLVCNRGGDYRCRK